MTTAELGLATTSVATLSASTATKALAYYVPGKRPGEGEAHPTIHPGPAILWVTASTICRTDLHLLKGDQCSMPAGIREK